MRQSNNCVHWSANFVAHIGEALDFDLVASSATVLASRRANSVRRRSVMFVEIPEMPSTSPLRDVSGTFLDRKTCSPHCAPTRS